MKNYKIAVAGTGYVGLSLSVLLAQHNQVMAVDIVQAKVDMINNHKSPIQDDYIEKYLAEKELNLTATLDAKAAYQRLESGERSILTCSFGLACRVIEALDMDVSKFYHGDYYLEELKTIESK